MTDSELRKFIISGSVGAKSPEDDAQDEGDTSAEMELRHVRVPVESHGSRLDKALAGLVPEFSRNYLQQLIEAGGKLTLETGWTHAGTRDVGRRWETAELGPIVDALIADSPAPEPVYGAQS